MHLLLAHLAHLNRQIIPFRPTLCSTQAPYRLFWVMIITTQPMNFAMPCSLLATAKCRAVLQSTHRQTIRIERLIVLPGFHSWTG